MGNDVIYILLPPLLTTFLVAYAIRFGENQQLQKDARDSISPNPSKRWRKAVFEAQMDQEKFNQ